MTKEKTYKNFKDGLKTEDHYSELIPPMNKTAFELLLGNIEQDGYIRDPLVTWNDVILDGHHRYKIARMLDMEFKVKKMTFKSIDEAKFWIVNNQIGRRKMTISQLAVLALSLVPMYKKLGKDRQSEGGKHKGDIVITKGMKTSTMAAKKVGVNENIVKDIINLDTYVPEIVSLIKAEKYDGLTVKEAKRLQSKFTKKDITTLIVNGDLSAEAQEALKLIRKPKKAAKTTTTNEGDGGDTGNGNTNNSVDDNSGNNAGNPGKDLEDKNPADEDSNEENKVQATMQNIKDTEKEVERAKEANKRKEDTKRLCSAIINKVQKEGTFSSVPKVLEGLEAAELCASSFVAERKMGKNQDVSESVVMIISSEGLNTPWFQLISSISDLFCDSKKLPVRILYFGRESSVFYKTLKGYGNISITVKSVPVDSKPLKAKKTGA